MPYYGYARQDRKDQPRVPITAKLIANLLVAAGANRVLTMDLHAQQIQGFFDIPVDHLFAAPVLIEHLKKLKIPNLTIVSPDAGGVERARAFARRLDADLAIIDKRRTAPNTAEVLNIIGHVSGRNIVICDDMIDTAGTLVQAADALKREGARRILACGVHAVLSGPAMARIEGAPLEEVVVTNSIPLGKDKQVPKITVLSVAPLLAEAITAREGSALLEDTFALATNPFSSSQSTLSVNVPPVSTPTRFIRAPLAAAGMRPVPACLCPVRSSRRHRGFCA